jgi:transposase
VLNVEDWAEIRRLHRAEGMPIRAIARQMKVSKNTVKKALGSHAPPRYQRKPRGSAVDEFEPRIRALLAEFPAMPTTVIMERVGWQRGRSVFFERVQQLRPLFQPVDPASRTEYQPGELAQCDLWFPAGGCSAGVRACRSPAGIGDGQRLFADHGRDDDSDPAEPGSVGRVLGVDLRSGSRSASSGLGQRIRGRPMARRQTPADRDDERIPRNVGHQRDSVPAPSPEAKGLVERANGYLETSFLPGRAFTDPADFNTQLSQWLVKANHRHHRRLECRPVDRWEADRRSMRELPPVDPVVGWRLTTRLPRDHYVRLDSNDYSVHPAAIGRRVEVRADLTEVAPPSSS